MERSVVLVKPDGVQRGLVGEIISRFERKGLHLVGIKMISLSDAILDEWYAHHKDKPFFGDLKRFMTSAPVVAMVWQGPQVASIIRKMIGVTKASEAEIGTVRGDFAVSTQYNIIHASENADIAKKEIELMFSDTDLFDWDKTDLAHVVPSEEK